jgi:twitching motility protein PilU
MNEKQRQDFENEWECNFAMYRMYHAFVSMYLNNNYKSAWSFRTITSEIPTFQKLKLPESLKNVMMEKRGLVLVVGRTGSGKSTSLAAMIDHRNELSRTYYYG